METKAPITKNVTVKSLSGKTTVKVQIVTTFDQWGYETNTVQGTDGYVYGTVSSYVGRTDLTPRANTRRDSKPKTLWNIQINHRPDFIDYSSRAAALRALVF